MKWSKVGGISKVLQKTLRFVLNHHHELEASNISNVITSLQSIRKNARDGTTFKEIFDSYDRAMSKISNVKDFALSKSKALRDADYQTNFFINYFLNVKNVQLQYFGH